LEAALVPAGGPERERIICSAENAPVDDAGIVRFSQDLLSPSNV